MKAEVEADDEWGEPGDEAEESPLHEGPCEHGVKPRSNRKVCLSARKVAPFLQGLRWVSNMRARSGALCARSAVGLSDVRARSSAPGMQGVRWVSSVSTVVGADTRSAAVSSMCERSCTLYVQGLRWVSNLRARSSALSVQGVRWGSSGTVVGALTARSAAGLQSREHGRQRYQCRECGGPGICEHDRRALGAGARPAPRARRVNSSKEFIDVYPEPRTRPST